MRKRIQHPRKQKPSRVQVAREKHAGSIFFTANVDGKLLRWADGPTKGEAAAFESAEEAEREALFALACRYLDAAAWQALQAIPEGGDHDAMATIDLLDLGLADDDGTINDAGRLVLERLAADAPELPEGPPPTLTSGEVIAKLRELAEASQINLDGPMLVHVTIDGADCSHLVEVVDVIPNGFLAQLDLEPVEVSS